MDGQLSRHVQDKIAEVTGYDSPIVRSAHVAGGCIHDARVIELEDARRFFVKSNCNSPDQMFELEALGLQLINSSETIRIPAVIGWQDGVQAFLILEWIETTSRHSNFFEDFGHQLANLHRAFSDENSDSLHSKFGLEKDNFLGSTKQPNSWHESWVSFWRENRFGFQFALARSNGYADKTFNKLAEQLQQRLDDFLNVDESPCLIHGDLWSGNYMIGSTGEPVLIDPAAYFASREAEFGMMTLFGDFDQTFYDAYEEVWPFSSGADDRIALYRLYHLLNHLNLFGGSYLQQCLAIMKRYA